MLLNSHIKLLISSVLSCAQAFPATQGHLVKYSGGSIETAKVGDSMRLYVEQGQLRLTQKEGGVTIPTRSVTEVSYGQEVHHRIGTAVAAGVVTLGIGAIIAFSKSKKHYIGLVWDNKESKGGVAFQVGKNDFRGLLAGIEGVTGKKAVDTDNVKNRPN